MGSWDDMGLLDMKLQKSDVLLTTVISGEVMVIEGGVKTRVIFFLK